MWRPARPTDGRAHRAGPDGWARLRPAPAQPACRAARRQPAPGRPRVVRPHGAGGAGRPGRLLAVEASDPHRAARRRRPAAGAAGVRAHARGAGAAVGRRGVGRWGAPGAVRARLRVQAVPQAVADQRRRRLRPAARAHGRAPTGGRLGLGGLDDPDHQRTVGAKVRWQSARLFKRWKSHGLVDQWRSGGAAARHASCARCTASCGRCGGTTGGGWLAVGPIPTARWGRRPRWCATTPSVWPAPAGSWPR